MQQAPATLFAITAGLAAAAAWAAQGPAPSPMTASLPAQGYLAPAELPDAASLLTPPPAPESADLARDRAAEQRALALRGSPRWELARRDADLWSPEATGALSCAAGRTIGPATTPRLDALLRKTAADLGRVSAGVKQRYDRDRPFEGNGQPTCTPEMEPGLRGNGSYPSGHATIGYGWALIVADLLPVRRAALLARGRAFADSRRVCNVHFRSDVAAGMALAEPVVARLRRAAAFRADLAAARAELAAAPTRPSSCGAEQSALALTRKDPA
ncbi:phosphatase PAP2 family protein [Novosphingobium piscinae]|uniref:Acid phosphatase n=1 Tax=Novosphingobium piscinae TaxID=1507448 RepID=A0A7X1FVE8_9SPHN|nr:phosphatase PAP2 family protein [Novosphingobium piscinae]MBC2667700.1 phosphatase PAP2 family protein [Novosphingobium piscinae]